MPLGFSCFSFISFFGGHLPQTSSFRSAKQILVTSFATQVRTCILGGRNIFCTLGEGQQRRGLMPLGLFLFFLFLERKRMLTLEINKNEVERARLVKEANFPVFLCTAIFNFTKPNLLKLC